MTTLQGMTVVLIVLLLTRAVLVRWLPVARRMLGSAIGILLAAGSVACGAVLVFQGALLPHVGRETSLAVVLLLGAITLGVEIHGMTHALRRPSQAQVASQLGSKG